MGHIPVMCKEILSILNPKKGNIIVDCTIGSGGHSERILELIGEEGKLIGIDRDKNALERTRKKLSKFSKRCEFIHEDFRNVDKVLEKLSIQKIDGALFDLGLSSEQLEDPERGFSFQQESPLDMRFDRLKTKLCAYDFVNYLTEQELDQILFKFGQERWHRRIARKIVQQRKIAPIDSTIQLRDLIMRSIPYRGSRRGKIHPATRTFQALRIAVNQELAALEAGLDKISKFLKPGARVCIISFHSLEDRIVKQRFKKFSQLGVVEILTKKPIRPAWEEVKQNPRARSGMLRAVMAL